MSEPVEFDGRTVLVAGLGVSGAAAARVLLAHCMEEPISPDQERIRIDIFLRDNLP